MSCRRLVNYCYSFADLLISMHKPILLNILTSKTTRKDSLIKHDIIEQAHMRAPTTTSHLLCKYLRHSTQISGKYLRPYPEVRQVQEQNRQLRFSSRFITRRQSAICIRIFTYEQVLPRCCTYKYLRAHRDSCDIPCN